MAIEKINRKASRLREQAYEQIKKAILSGQLRPGQVLVEEQLSQDLGLSRTPLREALVLLEREQLIEMIPYKGTFVTSLTVREARELFQVRAALEPLAIRLAIDRIPAAELTALAERHLAAAAHIDFDTLVMDNRALHDLILRYADNATLRELINSFIEKIHRYQAVAHVQISQGDLRAEFQEHLAILQALQARDAAVAQERLQQHLANSARRVMAQIEQREQNIC